MDWGWIIAGIALAVAAVALAMVAVLWRRVSAGKILTTAAPSDSDAAANLTANPSVNPAAKHPGTPPPPSPDPDPGPPVIIMNPTKSADWSQLRNLVDTAARDAALPPPIFIETTKDDPGVGQARRAVELGASVVVAAGGDGTVRAVAEGLLGSGTPLGIVPMGTGNLLARNLAIPLNEPANAVLVALTGRSRPIDVGWARFHLNATPTPGRRRRTMEAASGEEHLFLVIAGVGFDADMVAGADEDLKSRIGWLAYFTAAAGSLFDHRMDATVQVGTHGASAEVKARTVMIANCGLLPGKIALAPDARPDDGWLDLLLLDTTGGLIGWMGLARQVLLQRAGRRGRSERVSTLAFRRGREFTVTLRDGKAAQVDGEVVGLADQMDGRIAVGELEVRTP